MSLRPERLATSPRQGDALEAAFSASDRMTLDLASVRSIDAAGIDVLTRASTLGHVVMRSAPPTAVVSRAVRIDDGTTR